MRSLPKIAIVRNSSFEDSFTDSATTSAFTFTSDEACRLVEVAITARGSIATAERWGVWGLALALAEGAERRRGASARSQSNYC